MNKAERAAEAAWSRDHVNSIATNGGHKLDWEQIQGGWSGTCGDCGANATAFVGGSSSRSVRDARSYECSGPATAILTEIEDDHFAEFLDEAVGQFGASLDGYGEDEASL
jgi:hypothetical protein